MSGKLMMIVVAVAAYPPREASAEGGSMRGAFGAWAATETVGGEAWPCRIHAETVEIMV